MSALQIRRSTLASPDALRLITALNSELMAIFPEQGATHFSLSGEQVADGKGVFLIAYLDELAVGCGALRRVAAETERTGRDGTSSGPSNFAVAPVVSEVIAEVKRMYVAPQVRGKGIGLAILDALEQEARTLGVTKIILETGTRLAAAIKMYETAGYSRIPAFGEYLSSPETSLCFGKSLIV